MAFGIGDLRGVLKGATMDLGKSRCKSPVADLRQRGGRTSKKPARWPVLSWVQSSNLRCRCSQAILIAVNV